MLRSTRSLVVVFAISSFGVAGCSEDSEIRPVQICEVFANPTDVYVVPDDAVLVIEDATVTTASPRPLDDGELGIGLITTTVGGVTGTHAIGRIEGDVSSHDYASRTMKLYADPGTTVEFGRLAQAGGAGLPNFKICASGRLEAVPAP